LRHFSGEMDGLRLLMADELDFIAGGDGEDTDDVTTVDEITVTANPNAIPTYIGAGMFQGSYGWNSSAYSYNPDCYTTNRVDTLAPPDNAIYVVPENVDGTYLMNAINHLRSIQSLPDKISAFNSMFTNPADPYFIDFKDWGSAIGPAGSVTGGTITYYSAEKGTNHTGSVFEAFGNYFYGFAGVLGGIPRDILEYAAGYTQAGNSLAQQLVGFGMDAPEDRPHVSKGIADAISYQYVPRGMFGVVTGHC